MTSPTTTTGIRISPQLWAEFGLLCRMEGKTRNGDLVDMVRNRVVRSRHNGALSTLHSAEVVSERVRECSDRA